RSLAGPAFSAGEAGQGEGPPPYRHHRARAKVSRGGDQQQQEDGDDDADDLGERRGVERAHPESPACRRTACVSSLAAVGGRGGRRAHSGDPSDGGVAAIVAQARILAGLATQYRRVEAQVVWRRLEGNPAIRLLVWSRRGEEDLDPRVGILAADHVVLDVRVELAGAVAVDETCRYAERPQHVTHRRGEILAIAYPRDKEAIVHCTHAGPGTGGREHAREIAPLAQDGADRAC